MLSRAKQACYPSQSLKELPSSWIDAAFDRQNLYCLKPAFLEGIYFERQDIRRVFPERQFYLILCRNLVFTYFDLALAREILKKMLARLLPNGILIIGKKESLPVGFEKQLNLLSPSGIYQYLLK